ncbi:hypothetical protein [Glycomyces harbinensis]|uniref:Uncharacterized protein n=1 Tax=Glycomyces harbinensis TaxID=58114 RepID=A0A1G6SMY6_9ACTN|nr:hypothetical protein [Glycomyces harbinensis]SDD18001.1 hypothetical protein SAMN05216270_102180 [Glycomyces harbinensis]
MELAFVYQLLGAFAVLAVFGTLGVLVWRRDKRADRAAGRPNDSYFDPTGLQTMGQTGMQPGGLDPDRDPGLPSGGDTGGGSP